MYIHTNLKVWNTVAVGMTPSQIIVIVLSSFKPEIHNGCVVDDKGRRVTNVLPDIYELCRLVMSVCIVFIHTEARIVLSNFSQFCIPHLYVYVNAVRRGKSS